MRGFISSDFFSDPFVSTVSVFTISELLVFTSLGKNMLSSATESTSLTLSSLMVNFPSSREAESNKSVRLVSTFKNKFSTEIPSLAYVRSFTSKTVFLMSTPCSSKGLTVKCTLSTVMTTGRGAESEEVLLPSTLLGNEAINSFTTSTSRSSPLISLIATLL